MPAGPDLPIWVRWLTLIAGVLAATAPFYFSAPAIPLWGIIVGVWPVVSGRVDPAQLSKVTSRP